MGYGGTTGWRRPFLRHPSVRALLEVEGVREPDEAMRRRARRLVERSLQLGWEGPPFDLDLLASLCGYRVQRVDGLGEERAGSIDPHARRILLSAELPETRQRYTLAHEIAHTLFPDFGSGIEAHESREDYGPAERSPVEQLCQVGAAELLLPERPFRETCGEAGPTVARVVEIAARFGASFEATARRWVALGPASGALVVAHPEADAAPGEEPRLMVRAAVRGGGVPVHWARRSPVPQGSIAYPVWGQACHGEEIPSLREAVEVGWGIVGLSRCRVEAVTLPLEYTPPRTVLCLLQAC